MGTEAKASSRQNAKLRSSDLIFPTLKVQLWVLKNMAKLSKVVIVRLIQQ